VEAFDTEAAFAMPGWIIRFARASCSRQADTRCGGRDGSSRTVLCAQGLSGTDMHGREANVASLRQRYPRFPAMIANVENYPLAELGVFGIVFCHSLLHHVEKPIAVLRKQMACPSLLLLETVMADGGLPLLRPDEETVSFNQSQDGLGSSFAVLALAGIRFAWIYIPAVHPYHPDFLFKWRNEMSFSRDGHQLGCIFGASRNEIHNEASLTML